MRSSRAQAGVRETSQTAVGLKVPRMSIHAPAGAFAVLGSCREFAAPDIRGRRFNLLTPPRQMASPGLELQNLPAHPSTTAIPAARVKAVQVRDADICLCVHALSHWDGVVA